MAQEVVVALGQRAGAVAPGDDRVAHAAGAQVGALRAIAAEEPNDRVHEIRGLGALIGVQVGRPGEQIGTAVGDRMMRDHGVLVTVCGGNTIRLLLPYRAGSDVLREVWRAISRSLESEST